MRLASTAVDKPRRVTDALLSSSPICVFAGLLPGAVGDEGMA